MRGTHVSRGGEPAVVFMIACRKKGSTPFRERRTPFGPILHVNGDGMTQGARTADVCARFSLLMKVLVGCRNELSVISGVSGTGVPLVRIWIDPQDRVLLFGRGCQVANCLRVLLDRIGEQQGITYALEIDGVCFEPGRPHAGQEEAFSGRSSNRPSRDTIPAY